MTDIENGSITQKKVIHRGDLNLHKFWSIGVLGWWSVGVLADGLMTSSKPQYSSTPILQDGNSSINSCNHKITFLLVISPIKNSAYKLSDYLL